MSREWRCGITNSLQMPLLWVLAAAYFATLRQRRHFSEPRKEHVGKIVVVDSARGTCQTVSQQGGFVVYHACLPQPREMLE